MHKGFIDYGSWYGISEELLPQRSPEWTQFRTEGIGGSESAIIAGHIKAGSCDLLTIQDLWRLKIGEEQEKPLNKFITNGVVLEEEARKRFISATGVKIEPICVILKEHPYIRTSLDGWSQEEKIIAELKSPLRMSIHFKIVKTSKVPDYYYPQLQYQLLSLPDAEEVVYFTYMKSAGGFTVEIFPDKHFQSKLLKKTEKFWNHVINKTEPDPNDFKLIT
jgi:putative phage-type endonuclease